MRQQTNAWARECGWSGERRALRPWRLSAAGGSELLKAAGAAWVKSQYAATTKLLGGEENKCPVETSRGAAEGPGRLPLQSSSFTPGNRRGSPVAPNKLSIEFNSWTSKVGPGRQKVLSQKILFWRLRVCSIWAPVINSSRLLDYCSLTSTR